MNRQFIYGVGLALLGMCVEVVGNGVVGDLALRGGFGSQEWLAHLDRAITAFAAFLVMLGLYTVLGLFMNVLMAPYRKSPTTEREE